VNPRPGAASGARSVNANRIYEVVMGAMAQIVPERVIAASSGFHNPKIFGPVSPFTGKPFLAWMSAVGGMPDSTPPRVPGSASHAGVL
jgi:N-methylhydantoinase B